MGNCQSGMSVIKRFISNCCEGLKVKSQLSVHRENGIVKFEANCCCSYSDNAGFLSGVLRNRKCIIKKLPH